MATSNAATNYLERRILDFIFKNNSLIFASPGDSIYVGLATAVRGRNRIRYRSFDFTNYASAGHGVELDNDGSDSTDTQTATNAANIDFPGGRHHYCRHDHLWGYWWTPVQWQHPVCWRAGCLQND